MARIKVARHSAVVPQGHSATAVIYCDYSATAPLRPVALADSSFPRLLLIEPVPCPAHQQGGVFVDSQIKVSFSTAITEVNLGENLGEDFSDQPLNASQRTILQLMQPDPQVTARVIADHIGITQRQVEVNIADLKVRGLIERVGSARRGTWLVK